MDQSVTEDDTDHRRPSQADKTPTKITREASGSLTYDLFSNEANHGAGSIASRNALPTNLNSRISRNSIDLSFKHINMSQPKESYSGLLLLNSPDKKKNNSKESLPHQEVQESILTRNFSMATADFGKQLKHGLSIGFSSASSQTKGEQKNAVKESDSLLVSESVSPEKIKKNKRDLYLCVLI